MKSWDLSELSVLIIDDHRFSLSVMREVLRVFNIREVRVADNAEHAISMSKEFKPDVIFCDYEMSELGGLEFVRRVRSKETDWDVTTSIIMLTSYGERGRVEMARDAGASLYLTKPISPMAVYLRMAWLVERPISFVMGDSYRGPDRRRQVQKTTYDGEDRRGDALEIEEKPDVLLSKEEIQVLMA